MGSHYYKVLYIISNCRYTVITAKETSRLMKMTDKLNLPANP